MSKTLTSEEIFKLLTTGEYNGAMVSVACLNSYFGTIYDQDDVTPLDPEDYVPLSYTYKYRLHSLYGAWSSDFDEEALSVGFNEKGMKGFIADSSDMKDDLFITEL